MKVLIDTNVLLTAALRDRLSLVMNSRRSPRRWFLLAAIVSALLGACWLTAGWRVGVWVWREHRIYKAMERECHPVWKEMSAGRV